MQTEQEMVQLALAGDQTAWTELYTQHYQHVFRICRRMMRTDDESQDAVQDVFLQVFRKLHTFQSTAKLSTWIHSVTVRELLQRMRRCRAKTRIQETVPLKETHAITRYNPLVRVHIEELLKAISPGLQELFVLHYVHEYTEEDLSQLLGISKSQLKTRVFRAKRKMRKL